LQGVGQTKRLALKDTTGRETTESSAGWRDNEDYAKLRVIADCGLVTNHKSLLMELATENAEPYALDAE
jgi:hypothetical protein